MTRSREEDRERARQDYWSRRRPLNDETAAHAAHYGDQWTNAEDARLLTWDRTDAGLVRLAEELGRSTEAARQRYYKLLREPRDGVPGASARKPRSRRSSGSAGARDVTPLGPPCPVCGLHHPGEC